MTFARAITNVLVTTLLFALLGLGIGAALGNFTPDYYRNIFRHGHDPQFDPASTGLALGLTQGAAAGVVVGLALVALLCWRDVRCARISAEPAPAGPRRANSSRLLLVVGGLLLLVVVAGISFFLGALLAESGAYHRRYLEEQKVLAPVLASDPAFGSIELRQRSNGGVNASGKVPTPEDKERLQAAMIQAVGETRAKQIVAGVGVENKPAEH